ncbi:MAG: DMT family transporter [Alphaproteobacteria bacterium]|nr:DMT family transporter [Alphaproteobacteria bacterium]
MDTEPIAAGAARPSRQDMRLALVLMYIAPLLFTGNQVMARAAAGLFPPFAMAFWRWMLAVLLFLPFIGPELWRKRRGVLAEWRDHLVLGALGMGVCGAAVYIGAATTTATNIGIIYGASPVLIVALAGALYGERLTLRAVAGIALALAGMLWIILRGDIGAMARLEFTEGDLWIASASFSWAIYSVLLTHRPSVLTVLTRLAVNMIAGIVVLFPFVLWETATVGPPPADWRSLAIVVFLAFVPSIGAYQCHARVQKVLGASGTAPMLYVGPLYSVVVAWITLGEAPRLFHLLGALMILPGVYLATWRPPARASATVS